MDKFITALSDQFINPLIYLLFVIAFLVFLWGMVRFIAQGGDEDVRTTAKRHILYGLLGMFIMFSAFALIRLIVGSLGIEAAPIDKIEK